MNIKVFLYTGSVVVIKADVFYLDETWCKNNPWITFTATNGSVVAVIRQSEVIAIVKETTNENTEIPFK